LSLGVFFAWAAYQTGLWADDEVGRRLYDPRVLQIHQIYATRFAWLLTITVAIDWCRRIPYWPRQARIIAGWATGLMLLGSCALIIYVGHLGASLVYQQGASVVMPGQ